MSQNVGDGNPGNVGGGAEQQNPNRGGVQIDEDRARWPIQWARRGTPFRARGQIVIPRVSASGGGGGVRAVKERKRRPFQLATRVRRFRPCRQNMALIPRRQMPLAPLQGTQTDGANNKGPGLNPEVEQAGQQQASGSGPQAVPENKEQAAEAKVEAKNTSPASGDV